MASTEARYAIVLGHNRVPDLSEVIHGIIDQVDQVWVHDNASDPPLHDVLRGEFPNIIFVRESLQPPNLARFWNNMLDLVDMWHRPYLMEHLEWEPYKVAMLTDDVVIPPDWFEVVSEAMDDTGAAAGCTSGFKDRLTANILKTHPDRDLMNRMYGPAYILRGDANIRCDERLKWWWNDTDMDWKARGKGGMVMAPGPYVHNKYPNASTVGANAEQAGRDRETFGEIWGFIPW